MTTSVDTSYGSWPATTPPFITKYGVVTNPSTSFSTGVVLDPYGAPPSLFINNEQGVWYDPSDFTTMFQDSAGTTPVTAVEQPVGLILDKSKGLVLGPELVTNGTFDVDTAGWVGIGGGTLSWNSGELVVTGGGAYSGARFVVATTIGKSYQISISLRRGTTTQNLSAVFGSQSIGAAVVLGGQYVRTAILIAVGASSNIDLTISDAAATGTAFFDNISVRELPGNHATQATSTKRPILKLIGGKYSLLFDGVDDALATASIDFTATDKMTVFAGVRKLSDAAQGFLIETSTDANSNNGAFQVRVPGTGTAYAIGHRGTVVGELYQTLGNFASPLTDVLACSFDLQGAAITDRLKLRVDTAPVALPTAVIAGPTTVGNYGNYPLYIGSRGGTTLPFNGHLYSLLIRGAQSTDAQIVSAETYVNSKTGAY